MRIIIFLFLLFPIMSQSQEILDTCLTKKQIINITAQLQNNNLKIQNLEWLNAELELQVINYENLRNQDKLIIDNLTSQNVILTESIDRATKYTKPKWYQTNEFYFGVGVITVFTCAQILNLISR